MFCKLKLMLCLEKSVSQTLSSVRSILTRFFIGKRLCKTYLVGSRWRPSLTGVPVHGMMEGSKQSTSKDKWKGESPTNLVICSRDFLGLLLNSLHEITGILYLSTINCS